MKNATYRYLLDIQVQSFVLNAVDNSRVLISDGRLFHSSFPLNACNVMETPASFSDHYRKYGLVIMVLWLQLNISCIALPPEWVQL